MTVTIDQMLIDFAESWRHKHRNQGNMVELPQAAELTFSIFQVDVLPGHGSWTIHFLTDGSVQVAQGAFDDPALIVRVNHDTLRQLHAGDISPITAMGRARYSDPAPLDFIPGREAQLVPGSPAFHQTLAFFQRFFNPTLPERILMGEAHSRVLHGGHVVGLFYDKNFRSAWYRLNKGERVNDSQDTNPFPQAFVFLSGRGFAQFGEKTVEVNAGEAYRVPPGAVHMVWNESEEPLEMLFLAWGDEA